MTRALSVALALPVVLACHTLAQDAPPKGFTALFNGKDFAGFKFVLREKGEPAHTWVVKDGTLICKGEPYGFFHTEKSYSNYVLRFDWRFVRPADLQDDMLFGGKGGLLLHIQGDPVVWPKCVEVQGKHSDYGKIFGMGTKILKAEFNKDVQQKMLKPVGQWNTTEVTCQNGSIECKLNGAVVSTGAAELKSGPIGWQSEGAEIHFRHIWIKELE